VCATQIHYLNHDFGSLLTNEVYDFVATSMPGHVSGLGEWLFRTSLSRMFRTIRLNMCAAMGITLELKQARVLLGFSAKPASVSPRPLMASSSVIALQTQTWWPHVHVLSDPAEHRPRAAAQAAQSKTHRCDGRRKLRRHDGHRVGHARACSGFCVFPVPASFPFRYSSDGSLRGQHDACHQIDGVFSSRNSRSITKLYDDGADIDWGKVSAASQLQGVREQGRELDINASPDLDYDDFVASLGQHVPELVSKIRVLFETSRGCWWGERAHCTFCGLNGSTMAYRALPPARALQLIRSLLERYGDRAESFHCVDNIMPKEYVEGVFAQLSVPASTTIFYEVKADLTAQQIETIARGGVKKVQPGIESLATSTLKLMRKGTTAFETSAFSRIALATVWSLSGTSSLVSRAKVPKVYEMYARTLPGLFHLPHPQVLIRCDSTALSVFYAAGSLWPEARAL